MGYPARIEIMGAPIDPYTMEQTVSRTKDFVETGVFAHLAGVNADKLLQMRSDQTMDRMIRQCEIVNADGASMVMAARRLGIDIPERVAGIDLMHELCRLSQSEGYRIFLLGATRDTVETARRKLEESYPGLDICGIMDGYFDDEDFSAVGEEVASSRPNSTSTKVSRWAGVIEAIHSFSARSTMRLPSSTLSRQTKPARRTCQE